LMASTVIISFSSIFTALGWNGQKSFQKLRQGSPGSTGLPRLMMRAFLFDCNSQSRDGAKLLQKIFDLLRSVRSRMTMTPKLITLPGLGLLLLFAAAQSLNADTIATSVTCSAFGFSTVTNTANCSQGTGTPNSATSSSSASLDVSSYSVTANITTSELVAISAAAISNPGSPNNSSASGSANMAAAFSTAGPIRDGDLVLTFDEGAQAGSSSGWIDMTALSIGGVQGTCRNQSGFEMCTLGAFMVIPGKVYAFPFTLGQAFGFSYSTVSSVVANFDNGSPIGGPFNGTISFSLTETNGTPVVLSDVPEPGMLYLVLLPLTGLLWLKASRTPTRAE
jgi:hypothetical protein